MDLPECGDLFEQRYRLDVVLGEGGSARVFRAWDMRAGRNVAVKVLKPDGARYRPAAVRRFEREVRIIANLVDRHTVTLFASGRAADGQLYMVFEFVEGTDLATLLLSRGCLDAREAVNILRQVLLSLREAHQHGLLHRDIKPENILVFETPDDPLTIKLIDFGLARPQHSHASITKTGEYVGTPRYMSPESLTHGELTPAADVYSAGIVALEMLSGRDALHGNQWHDQFDRLITGHVFAMPGSNAVPVELMRIVERMTRRRPEDRYRSASAVLNELEQFTEPEDAETVTTRDVSITTDFELPRPPAVGAAGFSTTRAIAMIATATVFVGLLVVTLAKYEAGGDTEEQREEGVVLGEVLQAQPEVPLPSPVAAADVGVDTREVHDPTSGCGRDPDFEGMRTFEGSSRGLTRYKWTTRIPAPYDNARRYPVVVLFHHDDAGGREMIRDLAIGPVADREGFIVIGFESSVSRAWREGLEIDGVRPTIEKTAAQLCVDPERVFLLAHGTGTFAVEMLSCEPWVAGVATHAFLPAQPEFFCEPATARPAINIAPLDTPHVLVSGKPGCGPTGRQRVSLEKYEAMWGERNRCSEKPKVEQYVDGLCYSWESCDAPYKSCHIDGGFGWPGTGPRPFERDPFGCDGTPKNFPATEVVWDFFRKIGQ